ncbi:MAG: adenylyl-sulfate kinase [Thermodesulfobacteriota bacterium]|nr:adenylyl-sulfate kinase [Thermodesulfobacteriota bacterium]
MEHNFKNITHLKRTITRADRERLHGHLGFVVCVTGLSASGKTTLVHLVENQLHQAGYSTFIMDGDVLRQGLCSDLGFGEPDRRENIRRVGDAARLFVDAGIIVLTALIMPFRADRLRMRAKFAPGEFIEVYANCPLEVCAARDPKGLYKRAFAGDIPDFTGVSSPYEPPENQEIEVQTGLKAPAEAAAEVIDYLKKHLLSDTSGRVGLALETFSSRPVSGAMIPDKKPEIKAVL